MEYQDLNDSKYDDCSGWIDEDQIFDNFFVGPTPVEWFIIGLYLVIFIASVIGNLTSMSQIYDKTNS